MKSLLLLALVGFLFVAVVSGAETQDECSWVYEHPEEIHPGSEPGQDYYMPSDWGKCQGSETCSQGTTQSPIDIRTKNVVVNPDLGSLELNWHTLWNVDLKWSGYGQVFVSSWDEEPHPSYVQHKNLNSTFQLAQFHLHAPSEHSVDGELMDAEIHFVHMTETGNVAVVGIFVEVGDESDHSDFFEFVNNDDPSDEAGTGELTYRLESIALPLIVAELPTLDYYHYMGSFTTPPCTEGVYWFVIRKPIVVSPDQFQKLAQFQPVNNRPVLPVNDRTVQLWKANAEVAMECDECNSNCKSLCKKVCKEYDDDCESNCKKTCKKEMCEGC